MLNLRNLGSVRTAAVSCLLSVALMSGCKDKVQAAIDQAKAQAASTNTTQQVQYVDANGDTVTTTVTPPAAGQAQQVTTSIAPPAPGPKPKKTDPVITPLGGATSAVVPPADPNAPAPAPSDPNAPAPQQGVADAAYVNPPDQPVTQNAPAVHLNVPAGTSLAVRINQHISVKHNVAGDRFTGEIVEPISVNGNLVIPRGTHVAGRIDAAHRRGHFKGASILELRLTSMELNGSRYAIDTHDNIRTKKGKGKRTAGFIGGLTGAGMLIGGIASGGVGLAIGGASGAGAGTLLAGATGNRDIEIPAESIVRFRLADAIYIQ